MLFLVSGEDAVTIPDYVAIGVLIVLAMWAVADWIPRDKL
jgi:hypothetical protein